MNFLALNLDLPSLPKYHTPSPCPSPSSRSHGRSEEHTSELQSPCNLVCRLLLEKNRLRLSRPLRAGTGGMARRVGRHAVLRRRRRDQMHAVRLHCVPPDASWSLSAVGLARDSYP